MNITCEFRKIMAGKWLITSPERRVLQFAIGCKSKVKCDWGGDYYMMVSPSGAYYLIDFKKQPSEWDTGRLTFEIL